MGINTLGPDVNESYLHFSANKEGHIRFGLAGIKGVGEGAVQSIIDERNENGPYTDIYNFVERVNLNACNRKNLECLIIAGAFDLFDIPREQYFGVTGPNQTFLDTLVQYGQRYQMERNENSMSLFGGFDDVEIQKPKLPENYEEWSDLERLNRERDLVSIYLSGHPLDSYAVILKHICNMRCPELNDYSKRMNSNVTFGGIVTACETRFTKTGKPFGKVKIEDFEGSGELVMFGDTWTRFSNYFIVNSSLLITASIQPHRYYPDRADLVVTNVEDLGDARDKKIKRITISCNLNSISDDTITSLLELTKSKKQTKAATDAAGGGYAGYDQPDESANVEMNFNIFDSNSGSRIMLGSRTYRIMVSKDLLDYLESNPELEYSING